MINQLWRVIFFDFIIVSLAKVIITGE